MSVRLSLKYRIAIMIFLLEAVMMGLVLWQTLGHSFEASRAQLAANEQAMLDIVSGISRVALLTEEYADLQPYLEYLEKDPRLVRAVLADVQGRIVASTHPGDVGTVFTTTLSHQDHEHHFWHKKEISNAAGQLGLLAMEFSNAALLKAYMQSRNLGLGIAIAGMVIIAIAGVLTGFLLTRRLEQITVAARRFAGGELAVETGVHGRDELGELARSFDNMAQSVTEAQRRVHENERYNRMLFEQSPMGLALCRMNGELVDINPAYARILGRSVEETLTLSYWDITPHKYVADEQRQLESLNETGRYGPYEKEYIHKDGHLVPVRLQGLLLKRGEETFIWSSVEDITEHKQAEEKLRLQAAALESTANGVVITDRAGEIRWVNPAFSKMTGYGFEEAVGQNPRLLKSGKQDRKFYQELWDTILAGRVWRGELINRRKDGSLYIDQQTITPVRDEQGKIVYFVAIKQDITEYKRVEEREASLGRILDDSLNEIYIFDADTLRFIQVNRGAMTNLGYSIEEMQRLTPVDLKPEFTPASFAKLLEPLRHGEKEKIQFKTVHRRKNGSAYPVEVHLQLSTFESRPAFVAIILDITERKRAEEELEKHRAHLEDLVAKRTDALEAANKELESFSYSVSHDLRAPLRAIDGFSQALLEDYDSVLDKQGRQYLERMRAGAQRMSMLIDDLLQLSKVTRAELKMARVDLSALAQTITQELTQGEPGRKAEVIVAPGLQAHADGRLMRVVLENFLGNAWKFTAKKAGARIEFGQRKQDGEPVFYVRDNGAGFDMRYADKLFGAFQRLHKIEEFPGTGIGLATVQRIIHRHGGRVWAEGETGKGATFYFTLPAARRHSAATAAQAR